MEDDKVNRYDRLRNAAIEMQVVVGFILSKGGKDYNLWFNDLIKAQRNLDSCTNVKFHEIDSVREKLNISIEDY